MFYISCGLMVLLIVVYGGLRGFIAYKKAKIRDKLETKRRDRCGKKQ